jgi:hypothetical protein
LATSTSRKHRAPRARENAALARRALALGLVAVVAGAACRRGAERAPTASAGASAPQPLVLDAGPRRLPEDPVEGAKATAQWSEHLREEERERKQIFDRSHVAEHRAVLAALENARASYEAATSKVKLKSVEAQFRAALPALKKKVALIDPDRQSSNLLGDYDALVECLSGPYPSARLAAIDGNDAGARALAADFEHRVEQARDWLEADEAEERERERRE